MNAPADHANINVPRIAIACQGGGSHAAYVAGVLRRLLTRFDHGSSEPLRLVALSGTSGGAICAVVAWWGLLTGGPARAIERLEMFWEKNSALQPGEVLLNSGVIGALESLPFEIQFSPSTAPLSEMIRFATTVWPRTAGCFGFGDWMRPDYFQLEESLGRQLSRPQEPDFATVVTAICELCSVPADVQAWCADALDEALGGLPGGKPRMAPAQRYREVLDKVDNASAKLMAEAQKLVEPAWLLRAMDEYRKSAAVQVNALRALSPTSYQAGEASLLCLDEALAPTLGLIPRLFIGAVDVGSGEFRSFRSDRCQPPERLCLKSILASAAIPNLFKEVSIDDVEGKPPREYWDGLFSQNPPIKTFTLPPGETPSSRSYKPDEIWIAQVNPRRCNTEDRNGLSQRWTSAHFELFDRRNELSGNLSLFQEIDFIDAMNRRIDTASATKQDDQHIQVFTIPLDDPVAQRQSRRTLGYATKLDRDRGLKDALIEHGDEQAAKFLPVREFIVAFLNQPQPAGRLAYIQANGSRMRSSTLLNGIDQLHQQFNGYFRVFIEELAIGDHPSCACRYGRPWDVTLHWRASGQGSRNGIDYRANVRGTIHLDIAKGALVDGLLDEVHIVEKDSLTVKPPVSPPISPKRKATPVHEGA